MSRLVLSVFIVLLVISCTNNALITSSYASFDKTVTFEKGFKQYLDKMDALARKYSITINVQESFRRKDVKVENAIVRPVQTSNHLVGHAIDINIIYNNTLFNSTNLANYKDLPDEIKEFIKGCKSIGLRWGGDFKEIDAVHFDDNLYELNRKKYETLYKRYQENT